MSEGRYEHPALTGANQAKLEIVHCHRLELLVMLTAEIEGVEVIGMRPLLLHKGAGVEAKALREPAGDVATVICRPEPRPATCIHVFSGESRWA